jgi:hypothetical protein|tara:strand:+ start:28858 stop:29979 length:1122 start_codon:yes stop_codon:yes gene_type:complete
MTFSVTNTFSNGDVADATEVNVNFTDIENELNLTTATGSLAIEHNEIYTALGGKEITTFSESHYTDTLDIFAFTATTFIKFENNITYTGTLSAGHITWSTVDDQISSPLHSAQADDDVTDIITMNATGIASFSTNSGESFTAANDNPDNVSAIKDISYATGGAVVVAVGANDGANSGIWYSSDGGDNWTQSLTVTGAMTCVDMFSATTGFAVSNNGSVWITVNGGEDWTDTTADVGGAGAQSIISLSATTYVTCREGNVWTGTGEGAGPSGSTTQRTSLVYGGSVYISRIIKATNGNLYFTAVADSGPAAFFGINLHKSTDSGITWSVKSIMSKTGSSFDHGSSFAFFGLTEYDTNKLLAVAGQTILNLDEST